MRRCIAYPAAVVAALGAAAALGQSVWSVRNALLLWNRCPTLGFPGVGDRLLWAALLAVLTVLATLAFALVTSRRIAGWFALALVALAALPVAVLYFFGSSALFPEDAANWLPCGLTDDVAAVRALALVLPAGTLGVMGAALLVRTRRLRVVLGVLVGLLLTVGWAAVLIAFVLSP